MSLPVDESKESCTLLTHSHHKHLFDCACQDLDSGHHGSGLPLPPFRKALLERHLASQKAAGLLRKTSHKKKHAEAGEPLGAEGEPPLIPHCIPSTVGCWLGACSPSFTSPIHPRSSSAVTLWLVVKQYVVRITCSTAVYSGPFQFH